MIKLEDLCEKVLKNPEVRVAYEAERKILLEEIAEYEREKQRTENPTATTFESLRKMADNEIDYSDIPPMDDEMLNKGFAELPRREPSNV